MQRETDITTTQMMFPFASSLLLENCYIGDLGVELLASALALNSTLTHLNLSQNEITAAGIIYLSNALCVNTGSYGEAVS